MGRGGILPWTWNHTYLGLSLVSGPLGSPPSKGFGPLVSPALPRLAAATAKSLQSGPTLCDPIDGSLPGFPIPGILQVTTLEWVAISFSNAWKWKVKCSRSAGLTPSNPMDCSLPGSSIHGIFRARVLEWVAKKLLFSKVRKKWENILHFP